MAQTETTLIYRTLNKLGAVGSGQPVAAEDSTIVQEQIAPLISSLAAKRIVYIADSNDFEDAYLEPLADMLAQRVAADFGSVANPQIEMMAEREFRRILAATPSYETLYVLQY